MGKIKIAKQNILEVGEQIMQFDKNAWMVEFSKYRFDLCRSMCVWRSVPYRGTCSVAIVNTKYLPTEV